MSQHGRPSIEQVLSRAKKAAKQGRTDLAIGLFRNVLRMNPNHPVAKKGLRKLRDSEQPSRPPAPARDVLSGLFGLYWSGETAQAEILSRELLASFPDSVDVINVLGAALGAQGRFAEALIEYDKVLALAPQFAEVHSNRGDTLKRLGQWNSAIASYDCAIAIKPEYATAHNNRANGLKDMGQLVAAKIGYEKAIEIQPGHVDAHRGLGLIKTYVDGDPQIAAMEALYQKTGVKKWDRIGLCFALGKAYDDLLQYDQSFHFIRLGNELRNKAVPYDRGGEQAFFQKLKTLFADPVRLDGAAIADVPLASSAGKKPLFIVGMMRSGTSLVEQIIASHSEVHGAGELETMNALVDPVFAGMSGEERIENTDSWSAGGAGRIREGYLAALEAMDVSEQVITDKLPMNFRWIGFILSAFPDAKIVHVSRDARATCWSIYKTYLPFTGNDYAYDLHDLASFYNHYLELMSFWHARYPGRIYDLGYEQLTEFQELETRNLLAFCDLGWEEGCMKFENTKRVVATASAAQVRRRMYTGSSNAWRNYKQHLNPLLCDLEQ